MDHPGPAQDVPVLVEATGLDAAEQVLASTYAQLHLTSTSRVPHLRLEQQECGPGAVLQRVTFDMHAASAVDPLGAWVFTHVRAGHLTFHLRRDGHDRDTTYGPGQAHLGSLPEEGYATTIDGLRADVCVLTPSLLAQVTDGGEERPTAPGPVRFTSDRPLSAALEQRWVATWAAVREPLAGLGPPTARSQGPGGDGVPLARTGAARLLAATALAVFPNSTWDHDGHHRRSLDSRDGRAATYRRARAVVEESAHLDLSPVRVAAACGVSVRALRLAYARHGGTTARDHLRQVRLARAHQRLLASSAVLDADDAARARVARELVAGVAGDWGFSSTAGFVRAYRTVYGETPLQSLLRPVRTARAPRRTT